MTNTPIDLTAIAGTRWRLEYEQTGKTRTNDPWLLSIPAQHGHIYKHSDELLGVATKNRVIGLRLAKLPGITVTQEADDGFNLVFPLKLLPKVVRVVKPKRKRQLSPLQRERLARYAFKPAINGVKSGQNSTQTAGVDTLAA